MTTFAPLEFSTLRAPATPLASRSYSLLHGRKTRNVTNFTIYNEESVESVEFQKQIYWKVVLKKMYSRCKGKKVNLIWKEKIEVIFKATYCYKTVKSLIF